VSQSFLAQLRHDAAQDLSLPIQRIQLAPKMPHIFQPILLDSVKQTRSAFSPLPPLQPAPAVPPSNSSTHSYPHHISIPLMYQLSTLLNSFFLPSVPRKPQSTKQRKENSPFVHPPQCEPRAHERRHHIQRLCPTPSSRVDDSASQRAARVRSHPVARQAVRDDPLLDRELWVSWAEDREALDVRRRGRKGGKGNRGKGRIGEGGRLTRLCDGGRGGIPCYGLPRESKRTCLGFVEDRSHGRVG
jgi:hypothetical protein